MTERMTGKVQSFSVPFPPKELSPNEAGANKFKIGRIKKAYRKAVWGCLLEQKIRKMGDDIIGLEYTFYPPANYHYDDDGLIGRMKAARDQIAQHIGVDDNVFRQAQPVIAGKEPPHGRVQVTLRPAMVNIPHKGQING